MYKKSYCISPGVAATLALVKCLSLTLKFYMYMMDKALTGELSYVDMSCCTSCIMIYFMAENDSQLVGFFRLLYMYYGRD